MSRATMSILLLLVAMISIQFGASFAKQIFDVVHPAGITMLRISLAAIFLLVLWRPWRATWDRSAWPHILPYGAALGTMNLLFYLSLERIPLGIAVAVEFTGPLGLALLTSRRKQDLLWVLLAGLGIVLISPVTGRDALDPVGLLLALGAGFCWALYIIFGQRMGRRIPAGPATALGMLVAALVTIPVGAFYVDEQFFQARVWWTGLLVAALCSALPYSLEMTALKHLPTKTFGILMSIEPALAAMMGFLFLKETLNLQQGVAMGCIMLASAGCTLLSPKVKEA
ncbi:MAG TPA: DMT family transporter [Oligoflexus sp.]|uniref:EamA family transporter n=1 Tax=Oligoflexus sp. TaxID=1971216 RepID=UPI002D623985|nr:DMT family transporter [Oligoflexus sp.]HYX31906.1 DMT family transporter [Oligoflexus sp.]